MPDAETFPPLPWGPRGKVLRAILVAELCALVAVGVYSYVQLPAVVPLHFDARGLPTSWGSKDAMLAVPVALSIAPLVLLAVAELRFVLLRRAAYLVNLPAAFLHLGTLPPQRRSWWINRYFELVLGMGVVLTAYLVVLEVVMYRSMTSGSLGGWMVASIVAVPLGIAVAFLWQLRWLSAELRAEVG
ncbi:MAG: DUF1648 domain-containing protein [Chlorobi bacterium]|jgi:uncharacterized membrane protein|nr:DUF1648 domain-containing protein [Chlorobiota bacterium]